MEAVLERIKNEIESLIENDRSTNAAEKLYQSYNTDISKDDFENIYFSIVNREERKQTQKIKQLLNDGKIEDAYKLHAKAPGTLSGSAFVTLKRDAIKELENELENIFLKGSEQEAFQFYNAHKKYIISEIYETIKTKTLSKRDRTEFQTAKRETILQVKELISNEEYQAAFETIANARVLIVHEKVKYLKKIIEKRSTIPLISNESSKDDAFKLLKLCKGFPHDLNFSIGELSTLVYNSGVEFSNIFYVGLAEEFDTCTNSEKQKINSDIAEFLIEKISNSEIKDVNKIIASILISFPTLIGRKKFHESVFIAIALRENIYKDIPFCKFIKQHIIKNEFANALIIFSLLSANANTESIKVSDILALLKTIINKATNIRLKDRRAIENLIFPKCLKHSFSTYNKALKFCEGTYLRYKDGQSYVMCRNNKCDDLSGDWKKYSNASESIFLRLLKDKLKIPYEDILTRKEFILGMGALNRWNEIRERLVCGYEYSKGCSAPLEYSSTAQGATGWTVYATSFWHCSNESCIVCRDNEEIKISHCKGCGKIIDSRYDRQPCPRNHNQTFYICMDCGYCCYEHGVSGFCPECGTDSGWNGVDQYGAKFSCRNCGHQIKVPSWLKKNLNEKFSTYR